MSDSLFEHMEFELYNKTSIMELSGGKLIDCM